MGALAGHLAHLQENLDFTFGELKSILGDVSSGEMPAVEKVDGQNIFFKFAVDPETEIAVDVVNLPRHGRCRFDPPAIGVENRHEAVGGLCRRE